MVWVPHLYSSSVVNLQVLFQRAYVGGKDKETCAITDRFHCMVQWFFSSTKYKMKINLVCHYMVLWKRPYQSEHQH
jgi:hypothetical protein